MTFRNDSSFDGGRVRRRGRGPAMAGGGLVTVVLAVGVALLSGGRIDVGTALAVLSGGEPVHEEDLGSCTGQQANSDRECRLSGTASVLDSYWKTALPEQSGVAYIPPDVVSFAGSTSTGCGNATSQTGPFYCPADATVYIDVSFFDELRDQYGADGGELSEMYVVAHEFGHHIEQLTGTLSAADRTGSGPSSDSVRIELMADCLAGMWAQHATQEVDPRTGATFMEPFTAAQLADAQSAAAAVGDDHIQQQATGEVDPERWTHGSSEQRQQWFMRGYHEGTMATCNTMSAPTL